MNGTDEEQQQGEVRAAVDDEQRDECDQPATPEIEQEPAAASREPLAARERPSRRCWRLRRRASSRPGASDAARRRRARARRALRRSRPSRARSRPERRQSGSRARRSRRHRLRLSCEDAAVVTPRASGQAAVASSVKRLVKKIPLDANDGGGWSSPADALRSSYARRQLIGFVLVARRVACIGPASVFGTAFSTTPSEAKVASPREAHRLARLEGEKTI